MPGLSKPGLARPGLSKPDLSRPGLSRPHSSPRSPVWPYPPVWLSGASPVWPYSPVWLSGANQKPGAGHGWSQCHGFWSSFAMRKRPPAAWILQERVLSIPFLWDSLSHLNAMGNLRGDGLQNLIVWSCMPLLQRSSKNL